MTSIKNISLLLAVILTITGCLKYEPDEVIMEGMAPVYMDGDDHSLIKFSEARDYNDLSNILINGDYILIMELFRGIHFINNKSPKNPFNEKFLVIPGILNFTAQGNSIYANNSKNLLEINISDVNFPKVVDQIENFHISNYPDFLNDYFPKNYNGLFECYIPEKGVLYGWEMRQIKNPECKTI